MKKATNYLKLLEREEKLKQRLVASNNRVSEEWEKVSHPSYLLKEMIQTPINNRIDQKINEFKNLNWTASIFDFLFQKIILLLQPKDSKSDTEWKQNTRNLLSMIYKANRETLINISSLWLQKKLFKSVQGFFTRTRS